MPDKDKAGEAKLTWATGSLLLSRSNRGEIHAGDAVSPRGPFFGGAREAIESRDDARIVESG